MYKDTICALSLFRDLLTSIYLLADLANGDVVVHI